MSCEATQGSTRVSQQAEGVSIGESLYYYSRKKLLGEDIP